MNSLKGEVPLALADGRELTMVLDFAALMKAERAYAKPLPQLLLDAKLGFIEPVVAMLWGALQRHHGEMSLEDAGAVYQSDGDAVAEALEAAQLAAYPDPAKSEGKEGPNPPGRSSGRSGAKPISTRKRSGSKPRARST